MNYKDKIIRDPEVLGGKPIIKGTRIPVEIILRKLGDGLSFEELLEAYPNLKKEDILAAISYSADLINEEELVEY